MSLLQISQFNENNPVTVFHLHERITLDNFAELEKITKDAYNGGMRRLVIDLSDAPSLTSIGVRAIVVIHKILASNNGNPLKIAGAYPSVREVLQIAGITQFIELYNTIDEAVASF
jgi:anti-anti-sigma factor